MTTTSTIVRSAQPERRRLFEFVAMIVTSVIVVGLSRLEGSLFELSQKLSEHSDFLTTILYFGLINGNVILVLVLGFLIFRNFIKLVIERRRGVIGAKLSSKLVVALVFFAVVPTSLLFYVTSQYLTESFDTWFSSKVQHTIQKTQEAGALVYKRDKHRIESLARIAAEKVIVEDLTVFPDEPPVGRMNPRRLKAFVHEYRLHVVRLYDYTGHVVWQASGKATGAQSPPDSSFVQSSIHRFQANPGMMSRASVEVENGRDVVKGIAPIWMEGRELFLGAILTEERFDAQIIKSVEAIMKEFDNLKPSVQLIRVSYMILLVLIVLIIVFSATWLGFYVAKRIILPLQSLAEATNEVSLGNYGIELKETTDDETGQLVRSFNRMTRDLKQHEVKAKEFTKSLQEANLELDRRRKYMEVILRNITAGVISVDASQVITTFSRAAEKLLGIRGIEVIGRDVRAGLGENLFSSFWLKIEECIQGESQKDEQIKVKRGDKELTLIGRGFRIYDENDVEMGIVAVFDDASEQVNAQRVAAWKEVARRIAHEIKNPITPIKLSAQRLLRRFSGQFNGADRNVFETCVGTIVNEVDSLRDLVNEFSKFSRLPSIKVRPENINEIIKEVVNLYQLSYPQIRFSIRPLKTEMPYLLLDREQMNRVFTNLVKNATAAILEGRDKGGEISFKSDYISHLRTVRIEVLDTGKGIPDRLKSRVLDPYFSTKQEGTGLGLAIVNQIVSDHGGYLRISDNVPRGTRIIIELPLVEAVAPND